ETKTYKDAAAKIDEINAILSGAQASVVGDVAVRCREHARKIDVAVAALADVLGDAQRYRRSVATTDAGARSMLNRVHFETDGFSLARAGAVPIFRSSLEQGLSDRCYELT